MKKTTTRGKSPAKARVVDNPLDALSEPVRGSAVNATPLPGRVSRHVAARKASLGGEQDPHALQGARDNMLEVAIGREVRGFRNKLGITASDLARAADLSLGMLSKIENGVTSASLTTLQRLSKALGVPVTSLFRRFEERRDAVFVSAGQGLLI
jgi:DNA-binding XRE family transcriptional regulator